MQFLVTAVSRHKFYSAGQCNSNDTNSLNVFTVRFCGGFEAFEAFYGGKKHNLPWFMRSLALRFIFHISPVKNYLQHRKMANRGKKRAVTVLTFCLLKKNATKLERVSVL